jgi:hypothetical protein
MVSRAVLREMLAEVAHNQWLAWSSGLVAGDPRFGDLLLARWADRLLRSYAELTEAEKDENRRWADKYIQALEMAGVVR